MRGSMNKLVFVLFVAINCSACSSFHYGYQTGYKHGYMNGHLDGQEDLLNYQRCAEEYKSSKWEIYKFCNWLRYVKAIKEAP